MCRKFCSGAIRAGIYRRVDRQLPTNIRWRVKRLRLKSTAEWPVAPIGARRSEEHTSELQSLMRISYSVFCLKKKRTLATAWFLVSCSILYLLDFYQQGPTLTFC